MDCVDTEALGGAQANTNQEQQGNVGEAVAQSGGKVVRLPLRGERALQLIDGGRAHEDNGSPRPKMWLCHVCEEDIGVATSVVEPVWQGPLREAGRVRLSSGTKRVVCTHCKMRGKLTFVD